MYTNTITAALIAASSAVVSAGSAIVNNHCAQPVYLWSVSDYADGEMHTIAPGGSYSEPYRTAKNGGGVSIKMAKVDNLWGVDGVQPDINQFEYTLAGNIWYDISNINGNPFYTGGLTLTPSDPSCPSKVCPAQQKDCQDAYNIPTDDHATAACSAESNLVFSLCADGQGASDNSEAKAAPAAEAVAEPSPVAEPAPAAVTTPAPVAAPATTAAPNVEAEVITAIGHPDWVWTTFVTQVVTVYARDAAPIAEPTAAPAKRDELHDNMHKRAAHRHHFHRHGADAN